MTWYTLFVAAAALIALGERLYCLRNERRMLRDGAEEIAPRVFLAMAPVYTLHFPAAVLEQWLRGTTPGAPWASAMVVLFIAAKLLKLWAVRHLGDGWTMRVIVPRDLRVVGGGPYRHLRHPNYVAVIGEILALPLAGGAWITACVTAALFAPVLVARIRSEEAALLARPEYAAALGARARFLPGGRR